MSKLVDKERLAKLAQALDNRAKVLVKTEEERALAAEQLLANKDNELQNAINAINNADNGILAQAKEYIDEQLEQKAEEDATVASRVDKLETDVRAVETKAQANEDAIAILKGDDQTEGSVAKAVADAQATMQIEVEKKVDQSAYDAKVQELAAEDVRIAGLVKTEEERAKAEELAIREELAAEKAALVAADATVLETAKKHADDAITALVNSAPEAMNTLKELADAIEAHGTEYEAYVATVSANIATAKQEAIDAAADKDAALKAELQKEIDDDVKAETDRATAAEEALEANLALKADKTEVQEAVKAVDDKVAKEVEDRVEAINKEVEDRNAAIEEALEAYSTTAEVKAILGNVVNSLALTMENNQVVLKLGGVDGIALTSVSLDLATDDDIDAIIDGLDQE